jgi:hypothetical protein
VAGRGEDRAVVCRENVQPVGDVGGVVLARLKRQIKIGTEERGAEFGYEFFDRVAFGPETLGAEVARQSRFVCGPVRRLVREGGGAPMAVERSRRDLRRRVPTPGRRHGHQRSHREPVKPLAESICGEADRINPARVSGPCAPCHRRMSDPTELGKDREK